MVDHVDGNATHKVNSAAHFSTQCGQPPRSFRDAHGSEDTPQQRHEIN